MAETPRLLTPNDFNIIAGQHAFNRRLLEKDYFVTLILYLIKDVQGIYFKGGTALQKIFLNYSRLSEDIDLTLTRDSKAVQKEIEDVLHKTHIFGKITKDKDVQGFVRMVIPYTGFSGTSDVVFIDLNERERIIQKTEQYIILHFYLGNIPHFEFPTLSKDEMIAGKVAAAIGRNKPRDHYDIYRIIKEKIPIDLKLVKVKCRDSGNEFNIEKMFNRGQKLYRRWNDDLANLLVNETSFEEVMKTLAKYFKLKEKKEKKKISNQCKKIINK